MSTLSDDYLFVVAIDFGTTYSGYAFSSRDDFKNDPLKISAKQTWNAGSARHISLKTPTCLLLNDKEELESFGYEAENRYSEICMDNKQNKYLFFQRFKMQLYNAKNIKEEMIMEDITGKSVAAMKVFKMSIKALMQHLFGIFEERGLKVEKKEIRWVLTVPAIWSEPAKQFMRKSANEVGIADNQLIIALEPESASIYCQYLPIEKLAGAERGFSLTEDGSQYMVVDIGGGTADITIHEKVSKGKLKELCRSSGGDCGGTSIDMAFHQIFVKLVGAPILNEMKRQHPSAYLDIFRELEALKRTVDRSKNDKVTMSFPRSFLDQICKTDLGKDMEAIISASPYKGRMKLIFEKIRIDTDIIKDLFIPASQNIIDLMKDSFAMVNFQKVGVILLVGGFSESKILQDSIKAAFPVKRVIVPDDAELTVLKGAVLFGHRPEYIVSRKVRYTYGISTVEPFNDDVHDLTRRIVVDGEAKCSNVFYIYVKRGSEVELGSKITKSHTTIKEYQRSVNFPVYQSTTVNPMYTDEEGCIYLGKLAIEIPDPSKERRSLLVNLIFCQTELKVTATDVQSGAAFETVLNLINGKVE